MAKKKVYAEIQVKEVGLVDLGKACREINHAPFEQKVGLVVQLDEMISNLKVISDNLTAGIVNTDYDEIMRDFRDRGLYTSEDDVIIRVGDKIEVTLSKKDEKKIIISKAIKDIVSSLPEKYKETKIVVDEKAIADAYQDGKLEKILAPYVSSCEVKETRMRRSKIKTK